MDEFVSYEKLMSNQGEVGQIRPKPSLIVRIGCLMYVEGIFMNLSVFPFLSASGI